MTVTTRVSKRWKKRVLPLALLSTVSAVCWQPVNAFAAPTAPAVPYSIQTTDDIENLLNRDERKVIQEGLIWSGVYTGRIDGDFEQDTRDAMAALQKQYQQPGTGRLSASMAARLYLLTQTSKQKFAWDRITDSKTGVTLSFPAELLTPTRDPRTGALNLVSDNKEISLHLVNSVGVQGDAIDTLYKQMTENSKSTITYTLKKDNMFIRVGERGTHKFYSRYEQRGDEIRGYELVWFRERDIEMKIFSALIANSFAAFDPPVTSDPFLNPRSTKMPYFPYLGGLSRELKKQSANQKASSFNHQAPPKATSDGLGPRFSYIYDELTLGGVVDAYRLMRKSDLLAGNIEIEALDGMFMTRRPLRYIARPCRVDAGYSAEESAVYLCYEMVDYLIRQPDSLELNNDPALRLQHLKARLRLILLHATGHALIDLLNLPPPMEEEAVVDQLVATLILLTVNHQKNPEELMPMLQMIASGFKAAPPPQMARTRDSFSETHAWNQERYFNVLCMIYGTAPKKYAAIVDQGLLPEPRAASCKKDAPEKYEAWVRFLSPHVAPRYQTTVIDSVNRQEDQ